ncbi:MAG: hypothetical protein H6828_04160 [Planctomycetes bacterium]|nr:hypothetical protein [Planctomycetota bacterium]
MLTLPDRAHEAFALRCAAALALDADLAAVLRRERAPAPLAAASDAERLRWRLLVIGAVPLGLALLGLLRRATA